MARTEFSYLAAFGSENMETVSDEMDTMLDASIRIAVELLEKDGEFFPFGVAMSLDGETKVVAGYTGDEHPLSDDVIEVLRRLLAAEASKGRIKASAITSDIRVRTIETGNSIDAIRVHIEHMAGDPVTCIMEYRFSGGNLEQGELTAEEAEACVF